MERGKEKENGEKPGGERKVERRETRGLGRLMSDETKGGEEAEKAEGRGGWRGGPGGPGGRLKVETITYLFDCEKERAAMRERSGRV